MDLNRFFTTKYTFECLKDKRDLTIDDIYILARYPYISLTEYCTNITPQEQTIIKEIEDLNIYYFINILSSLLGEKDDKTQELLNISFKRGPLRAAVMFAKMQSDPVEQFITLIEKSCQILLSYPQKKENFLSNLINVKINGKMPKYFLFSRQKMGDQWFNNFIENKLILLRSICRYYKTEKCFSIILTSIIYSLYKFTPARYNIQSCNNEDEALRKIINTFFNHIEYIKNK